MVHLWLLCSQNFSELQMLYKSGSWSDFLGIINSPLVILSKREVSIPVSQPNFNLQNYSWPSPNSLRLSDIFCENKHPWLLMCFIKPMDVSVQFSRSVMSDSLQPHEPQHTRLPCASPTPGTCSTQVHWVSDTIQQSHPLLSPFPPAFNLPSMMVFSNESVFCIRWPKYWSFSFSICSSNKYSELI